MDVDVFPRDFVTPPSFTKEQGSSQHLEHVQTVNISEHWVTHLTWLPWTMKGKDECKQQLRLKTFVGRLIITISGRRISSRLLYFGWCCRVCQSLENMEHKSEGQSTSTNDTCESPGFVNMQGRRP